VNAERLAVLEARIAAWDGEREKGRVAVGAGVAIAIGVAGLWALAGVILAVAFGRAGVRYVRRELAGAALIEFERRRDRDLRFTE
jgi:hypothetical protein